MEYLELSKQFLLGFVMVVMALILLLSLIRAILGPRFTDRIVAINMIGTQTIIIICILAFLIGEQYLVDIALIYAMISFLAVVAMVNIYLSVFREKAIKQHRERELWSREHEIERAAFAAEMREGDKAPDKAEQKEAET